MRRRIRHPRWTRSRDTCSGKRRAVKRSASLCLLLVDCREDLPHLVWLGLSFVVLNVYARVAGPRSLEDGMESAGGSRLGLGVALLRCRRPRVVRTSAPEDHVHSL